MNPATKEGVMLTLSATTLIIGKLLVGPFVLLLGIIALNAARSYRIFGSFSAVTPSALLIALTLGAGTLAGILFTISKYLSTKS